MLLQADDRLHPVGSEQDWFEAYWFGFNIPDRHLSVYVYPWFRPNMGLWGGGVLAWDDRGSSAATMLYHEYAWARPFDGEDAMIEGTTIATPQGVTIDCLEPAEKYRVRYDRPALAFDVMFTATGPANQTAATTGEENVFKGHIDQPGRYTGWVRIGDETLEVDCHCLRDRSWGPRTDDNYDMHIGYYHATASAEDAFLMVTHASPDADNSALISGYLIRNGQHSPLAEGKARVARNDDHSPATCTIEAKDELGRELRAEGNGINRAGLQLQPGMFNWSSLAEWRFDGCTAYGELQDTWHPDKYRKFVRGAHAQ
jgi:hypothetical protein|tara:strand:- start:2325 stop:3266 length:942 start_codon:yes stop_codon:yes gene_type:complete